MEAPKESSRLVFVTTMISLASAAFGVVAALAWNAAITELFRQVFGDTSGIVWLFIYAIIVTIIAVVVMVYLGRLAQRLTPPRSEPPEIPHL